jgi:hypothetical protein
MVLLNCDEFLLQFVCFLIGHNKMIIMILWKACFTCTCTFCFVKDTCLALISPDIHQQIFPKAHVTLKHNPKYRLAILNPIPLHLVQVKHLLLEKPVTHISCWSLVYIHPISQECRTCCVYPLIQINSFA